MKTYLVTGCAGLIGARVAAMLLEQGNQVVGLDNLNDYYDVRLKRYRLDQLTPNSAFTFHETDIENREALAEIFAATPFDGVINLAARAGVRYSIVNPYVYFNTNANGTLNLLELMREHGTKKFVLASTSSLYAGQKMPYMESLPVNTPISPYAASKKAAEVVSYTYHALFQIDVTVLRYFTVYGPAGRPDMSVYRFIKWIDEEQPLQIFGDGTQSRDFTYVDDIARGTILALKPLGYEIINLGGGNHPISLNTMIKHLERHIGKRATIEKHPFHNADVQSTWADISRAKQLLNWVPEVSPEAGFQRSVEWYLENIEWAKQLELPTA